MATSHVDVEFFVQKVAQIPPAKDLLPNGEDSLPGSKCRSLELREHLLEVAIKKNGKARDKTDENLLFPPTIIKKALGEREVRDMLTCKCTICASVTGKEGRELLSDNVLVDAITTERDEQRKLFALLVFMGAGFAARHICSFRTRGWDIAKRESSLLSQLFEPLERATRSVFPSPGEVTHIFTENFKRMWELFDPPTIQIGSFITDFDGVNLPFLNDRPLNGDKGAHGSMYCFEIHPEFRGSKVPAVAVRKELPDNKSTLEERRILEFLAQCNKPNFVQLLFWYRVDNKINYVFPRYPGSLHQLLDGQIDDRMIDPPKPGKYRTILQHWLWQGMVDTLAAMKFFHFPDQGVLREQLIAAHFDLKPANILVTETGSLIVTDFGQARMKAFNPLDGSSLTAQIGDANYQPPPLTPSPTRKPVPGTPRAPIDQAEDVGLRWNRAYDIWSMACIMTEVIEYIIHGSVGFKTFRKNRFDEDPPNAASAAFWKPAPQGGYQLKSSVQEGLRRLKLTQDRYLIMVTDLIETMFAIDPLQRPPIAHCFAVVSEDIPTDEWPLKDEDEISICGLGTNPQLRNMRTQFMRKSESKPKRRRCKMYLLSSSNSNRVRVVIEFEREVADGDSSSKTTCVLSDSARYDEEEFKLLSLFSTDYKPNAGRRYFCSFGILHHSLTFVFDDEQRGPQEYYHFLTAVTRQRSLRPQVLISISKCTVKLATLKTKKEFYTQGHIQIWKELTEEEYMQEFTYNAPMRKPSEVGEIGSITGGLRSPTNQSVFSHSPRAMSVSSSSSGSNPRSTNTVKTRRLVVFTSETGQPGALGNHSRFLTINLTNRFNVTQIERTGDGNKSALHVTFRAVGAAFYIGNFPTKKDCPGIPLDPDTLARREDVHVDWVELEFKDMDSKNAFMHLWNLLYPNDR